jgi:hypothetical protein
MAEVVDVALGPMSLQPRDACAIAARREAPNACLAEGRRPAGFVT